MPPTVEIVVVETVVRETVVRDGGAFVDIVVDTMGALGTSAI